MNHSSEVDPELLAIGNSLRNIRRQQGLTLRDVEGESQGRWKAVVVGSYERGDRALTLKKAILLAKFYRVPLDQLLGISRATSMGREKLLTFNLGTMRAKERELPPSFIRFFQEICRQRSDWNGELLTIRASDYMTLAIILDLNLEKLRDWIDEHALSLVR